MCLVPAGCILQSPTITPYSVLLRSECRAMDRESCAVRMYVTFICNYVIVVITLSMYMGVYAWTYVRRVLWGLTRVCTLLCTEQR